jgi:hypothetical protein
VKKVNPLNVLDIRKVDFCPPYFETVTLNTRYNFLDALREWIHHHCSGRYYVGQTVSLDEKDAIAILIKVGFEEKKELSYFMLACPHLKYA